VKRAASVTLLCMGVGGVFAANGLESRCGANNNQQSADWSDGSTPTQASTSSSCRSSWWGHSHSYSHGSSFGHSGVARGGFGGSGHGSAGT
jgi:hypothetical protein